MENLMFYPSSALDQVLTIWKQNQEMIMERAETQPVLAKSIPDLVSTLPRRVVRSEQAQTIQRMFPLSPENTRFEVPIWILTMDGPTACEIAESDTAFDDYVRRNATTTFIAGHAITAYVLQSGIRLIEELKRDAWPGDTFGFGLIEVFAKPSPSREVRMHILPFALCPIEYRHRDYVRRFVDRRCKQPGVLDVYMDAHPELDVSFQDIGTDEVLLDMFALCTIGDILGIEDASGCRDSLRAAKHPCHYCNCVGLSYQRCGGCKAVWYCSVLCQKRDWREGHQTICKK